MSTEDMIAEEYEPVDLVDVMEVELIENAKPTKHTTVKVNQEYCALLKVVCNLIVNIVKDESFAEHIETLREAEMQLNKFHSTFNSQNAHFDDSVVLAQIYLKLAEIYCSDDRRDKLYIASEHLIQCVQLLEGKELDRKVIFIVVKAFYELGLISMKLKDLEESEQFMRKAYELYLTYTERKDDYTAPICFPTVTGIEAGKNYTYEMDLVHASVLQTLLSYQYYNISEYSKMDNCRMIMYAHKILNKMLKAAPSSVCYSKWALFSSLLSSEFLKYKCFNNARHYLAAASLFLNKFYQEELMKTDEQERLSIDKTKAHDTYINVAVDLTLKCVKYGNTLLRSSGERLLHNKETDERPTEFAMPLLLPELLFADLEDELQDFTALIIDTYIMDYKGAKAVFQRVLKWLEEAKKLSVKGKITRTYADISRGIFHAYKYFACYEREKSEQMKLYKQLMDALHDLFKSLNADDDANVRKYICLQQVLASYSLLEIKTEDLELHDKINSELSAEIDKLVKYNVYNSEVYLYGNKRTS